MRRREFLRAVSSLPVVAQVSGGQDPSADGGGDKDWRMFGLNLRNTTYAPDRNGPTEDAEARWVFETGQRVFSSPAVVDGVVYASSDDGILYALDTETGEPVWCRSLNYSRDTDNDGADSSPAVVDGRLYVGNRPPEDSDTSFYCLDAETGEILWRTNEMNPDEGVDYANAWVRSSPAVHEGRVYFGSWDHHIYCYDAETGEKIWEFETGLIIYSSPAVHDGRVYFGSLDSYLYALDAETGELVWRFEAEKSSQLDRESISESANIAASPAIRDGTVYFTENTGNAYALDAEDGTVIWKSDGYGLSQSAPAVDDERMYTSRSEDIVALDTETGEVVWSYETQEPIYASNPSVTDEAVYMGSNDGYLYALEPETGNELWRFETDDWMRSTPAIVDGSLYFGSYDSNIYAVEENPESTRIVSADCDPVLPKEPIPRWSRYPGRYFAKMLRRHVSSLF